MSFPTLVSDTGKNGFTTNLLYIIVHSLVLCLENAQFHFHIDTRNLSYSKCRGISRIKENKLANVVN